MAVYTRLYHCTKCGSILGKHIVKLGNSCMPPSVAGQRNLECISNRKYPQGVSHWPSEYPAIPKCTPRLPSQLSSFQLQPARTPLLDKAQQYEASVAAEASMSKVASASKKVASLVCAASSSSSSGATNPLPITFTKDNSMLDDSSGSD